MAKRRKLHGKKLLVVAGSIAGASALSCSESSVANLIAPPDAAADASDAASDTGSFIDAVVANLIAPPDAGIDTGPPPDGSPTDGAPEDADSGGMDATLFPFDAPIANLIPPPDSGSGGGGGNG